MKITKRVLSIVMAIVTLVSVMGVAAEALDVVVIKDTDERHGYMVPVNSKGSEVVSTVKVYGQYDYIDFYIKTTRDETTTNFFYEIYSDKNLTNCVETGGIAIDSRGEFSYSLKLKLKGMYKTNKYYVVTYAAVYNEAKDQLVVDGLSMRQFTLVVDRTTAFSKQMVLLKEAKNTVNGAYITWSKLSGASKYYIYRRSLTGTKWTKVGTVSSSYASFTDTSVKNINGKFVYTVKAINKNGTASRYHYAGLTCLFAKTPVMSSVSVVYNNAVEIKWGKTSPSAKYDIYRKEGSGSWKKIKSSYSGTTYKDTTAKNNKKYTYTVRAVIPTSYGTAISSYYSNSDKAITYLEAPILNEVAVVDTGINVSWNAVSGAKAYTVYRKPLDGSTIWKALKKVGPDVTSYIDTTASITDGAYIYTVRSEGEKNRGSYYSKGAEFIILEQPVIEVGTTASNQVKISWNEVPYATNYEIYCKAVGGEWELLGAVDSTGLYYLYDLNRFGDFEFRVRAVRNNKIFSEYSDTVTYHQDAMVICSSVAFTDGIELGWQDYGYESYNIYRRLSTEDEGAEVLIATVTGNTFKDTTVENDVVYKYKVIGVIDGEEQRTRTYVSKIGIATTIEPPRVPQVMVINGVLTQYSDYHTAYAYNFKYGYWDYISFKKTKEYYEEFIQDGKMKFAYSDSTSLNLKTPIESTIKEKVWFDNKIDYTVNVKNKDITVTCKSLGNIKEVCINHLSFDLKGRDTLTVVLSLRDDKTYCDLEIQVETYENDRATVKERIKL